MSELTLIRALKLGARGKDVRAMKRGLARAGHGRLAASANPLMGPFAVRHLKNYQHKEGIPANGMYDKASHASLIQWFDKFARQLYQQQAQWIAVHGDDEHDADPAKGSLQLPKDFVATHQTAGLPGFPAVDVFAAANTVVLAPEDGIVDRLSGHEPKHGGPPGGPYGWSIYLAAPSGKYYMTHLATRSVTVGQRVKRGDTIATVCDSAVSGKPNTSHVHMGKKK